MALVNCPECGNRISSKANACPQCGCPISNLEKEELAITNNSSSTNEQIIPFPSTFPSDLRIGQQITNWSFDAAFEGIYDQQVNTIHQIPSGKADVLLHTHGIRVMVGLENYDIHFSQIINIQKTTSAEIAKVNKSVIGRAVVGGLIMGPLGAIVGGISGTTSKDKLMLKQFVVINFWDIDTKSAQSILIQCDNNQPIDAFIRRQIKESQTNLTENRVAEEEHTPLWMILCILIIIASIIIAIVA